MMTIANEAAGCILSGKVVQAESPTKLIVNDHFAYPPANSGLD